MSIFKGRWGNFQYRNIANLLLSIVLAFLIFNNSTFRELLYHLGGYSYLGAFIGGMFFVSSFSVSIGIVVLILLINILPLFQIALIAGLGAAVADLLIFRFVRDSGLIVELKQIVFKFKGDKVAEFFHREYLKWVLPVLGAIIIASPLPDELGVGLMGIAKMKQRRFILLAFILNTIGIYIVLKAAAPFV